MISTKCVCQHCVSSGRGPGKMAVYKITYGLATTVYLSCLSCPLGDERKTIRAVPETKEGTPKREDVAFSDNQPPTFGNYTINYNMVLLMQSLGIGLDGLKSILAHLGIAHDTGKYAKWKKLQDTVGNGKRQRRGFTLRDGVRRKDLGKARRRRRIDRTSDCRSHCQDRPLRSPARPLRCHRWPLPCWDESGCAN